jgi:WXG100 family type VII secretion target
MNGTIAQEWEGAAFKAYLQQYDALEKQVKSFTDLLGNINKQLDKYADTIQQRDAEDAKGFGFK